MNRSRRPFVGGNWKMHTRLDEARTLARAVAEGLERSLAQKDDAGPDVAIYPPFPWLTEIAAEAAQGRRGPALGAQDVWPEPNGAFTGEVSLTMLTEIGVTSVLAGHSERRHVIGEPDDLVHRKTRAILDAALQCVLCVGETIDQRRAGETDHVNERQVRAALDGVSAEQTERLVIAYEPVWAIGTGETATPDDAQSAHRFIRDVLGDLFGQTVAESIRIVYGGSVKPNNAADLFAPPDVDGGLIGGASLKADDFLAIADAAVSAFSTTGTPAS